MKHATIFLVFIMFLLNGGSTFIYSQEFDYWGKITSYENPPEGNPELEKYLQSLTPEQMLIAARQAAKKVEEIFIKNKKTRIAHGVYSGSVAALHVALCLEYYPDKIDNEKAINPILSIISDKNEHFILRESLIYLFSEGESTSITKYLTIYAQSNIEEIFFKFENIITDNNETASIRKTALWSLYKILKGKYDNILRSDPNVIHIAKQQKKVVHPSRLLIEGKLNLDPTTKKKIQPLEKMIINNIEIIKTIIKDKDSPKILKDTAKRSLKFYSMLPLKNREEIIIFLKGISMQ